MAVNQKTLEAHPIPATEASWSPYYEINQLNQKLIAKDLQKITAAQGTYKKGTPEQKIADLYQCINDKETRNSTSPKQLKQILAPIQAANSTSDLLNAMNGLYNQYSLDTLITIQVSKSPNKDFYSAAVEPETPVLPKEQLLNEPKPGAWNAYKKYISDILVYDGQLPAEATKNAAAIFAWEQKMAPYLLSGTELNNDVVTSHTISISELKKITKNLQGSSLIENRGIGNEKKVISVNEKYLRQLDNEFTNQNTNLFKNYLLFRLTNMLAPFSSDTLANLQTDYVNQMVGIQQRLSDKELTEQMILGILPDEMGTIYVKNYCTPETIANVKNLVNTLRAIHRDRLVHNTWLGPETKKRAIEKLDALRVFIGGPADDDKPLIETMPDVIPKSQGGTFLGNMLHNMKLSGTEALKLIGTKFNPDKWCGQPAYIVNAFYSPANNSINIPAGILHSPVYDSKADYGTNLGGIGAIIGHELSHAFDNNGALFDKNGLMKNWWTKKDFATFQKKAQAFYPYYEKYTLPNNQHMIGSLVVSEAIADCGGLSVVTQAANGDKQVLRNLYRNYAACGAMKFTDEIMALLIQTDPHPIGSGRINCSLSTTPGFYDAYDIKPGDGMYVAPENRVAIW